jgi:hypothetical protein
MSRLDGVIFAILPNQIAIFLGASSGQQMFDFGNDNQPGIFNAPTNSRLKSSGVHRFVLFRPPRHTEH